MPKMRIKKIKKILKQESYSKYIDRCVNDIHDCQATSKSSIKHFVKELAINIYKLGNREGYKDGYENGYVERDVIRDFQDECGFYDKE